MFWADKLLTQIDSQVPQLINDSKTPSGRAHVGALRGVIIHDVILRVLREHGISARYTFGVDDYDPLDELPYGRDEHFQPFLGKPLCEVPPPPGSTASDMADYYISDFFSVFDYLGVKVETYRLRDIYRSGCFDAAIDAILSQAHLVRDIYHRVSGAERSPSWLPLQMICQQCGRIGTTEAYAYDGKEVSYRCRPDMVKWAKGCGYEGKNSPFTGASKLPWKLEWVAKWAYMGITIEGAGKDHNTRGGARDVATQCLTELFHKTPPLNIPYEFFLVGGAKMSSSRGIGVTAREMADFLPPEILRFLILRTVPNRRLDFAPSGESVVKLFNDFDRCRASAVLYTHRTQALMGAWGAPTSPMGAWGVPTSPVGAWGVPTSPVGAWGVPTSPAPPSEDTNEGVGCPHINGGSEALVEQSRIYRLSELKTTEEYDIPGIQLIQALVQLPHIDVVTEVQRRSSKPLTPLANERLQQRIASVRYWLQNYADPDERLELKPTLPPQAANLSIQQKLFLQQLAAALATAVWEGEALQSLIFAIAKTIPIPQPEAFSAIYTTLFARTQGPKAGPLFSYLERDFLIARFHTVGENGMETWGAPTSSILHMHSGDISNNGGVGCPHIGDT